MSGGVPTPVQEAVREDVQEPVREPVREVVAEIAARVHAGLGSGLPFEAVAEEALLLARPHERLSIAALADHVASTPALPRQLDPEARFGTPPVTLHAADDFVVDLYLWLTPATGAHSHGFTGAFAVVEGRSAHLRIAFEPDALYADGALMTGPAALESAELLRPGDVRPIERGLGFVHVVAHLTRPSLSLCVRTTGPRSSHRTHGLLPPSVAVLRASEMGETARRKLQLARFLLDVDRASALDPAGPLGRMADLADDWLAFWILHLAGSRHPGDDGAEPPLDAESWLRARRPRPWIRDLLAVLDHDRSSPIDESRLRGEGQRLLALLTRYGASASTVRQLVSDLRPEAAKQATYASTVLAWLRDLIAEGGAPLDVNETAEVCLGSFIAGGSERDAAHAVLATWPDAPADAVRHDVAAFLQEARRFSLLRPFLPVTAT